MKGKARICHTCGKEYHYCPRCREDENKPTWMFVWDTLECKEVFNILSRYNSGDYSKEEAREALKKAISHEITFTDAIQKEIDEILKEEIVEMVSEKNSFDKEAFDKAMMKNKVRNKK